MHYPLVPQRIASVILKMRLMALLQDPVQGAISQYFHSYQLGLEPLDVEEALTFETGPLEDVHSVWRRSEDHLSHHQHSYVSRHCYDKQLLRRVDLFSTDQLLVLRSEDLLINARRIWERALEFLQLEAYPLSSSDRIYAGGGEVKTIFVEVCAALYLRLSLTYRLIEENCGMTHSKLFEY